MSSPGTSTSSNGFINPGKVQFFEKREDSSDELWTQLGNDIVGKGDNDMIGDSYVGLNSSDGSRVYFSGAGAQDGSPIRIYQFDSPSQEWVQLAIDTSIFLQLIPSKNLITISAGNRIALSPYNNNISTNQGSAVTIYDWKGGSWNQLGPPISSSLNEKGFGRSISMNDDGTLLVISVVDPKCDGVRSIEEDFDGYLQKGASTDLCGIGYVLMYQYNGVLSLNYHKLR